MMLAKIPSTRFLFDARSSRIKEINRRNIYALGQVSSLGCNAIVKRCSAAEVIHIRYIPGDQILQYMRNVWKKPILWDQEIALDQLGQLTCAVPKEEFMHLNQAATDFTNSFKAVPI
jgi:hypothetical protein